MSVKTRVVYWILALFTIAFLARLYGQITGKFEVIFDPELVEFTRCSIVAALGIETFSRVRKLVNDRKNAR